MTDEYNEDTPWSQHEKDKEFEEFLTENEELMEIAAQPIASDNAIFFGDWLEKGCGWHSQPGRLLLCRKTPNGQWENALIYQMTNFPQAEITDDIHASLGIRIWIEPENWQPLNLPPNNERGEQIFSIFLTSIKSGIDIEDPHHLEKEDKWYQDLKQRCRGKTNRQYNNEYGIL